jgi:hypothetical protein
MNDIVQTGGPDHPAWDPNSGDALPAYLSNALGELGSNIPDRQTVPSLSYEGKTWTIVKDGNKTKLESRNGDGDMVPVPVMRVVILNFNGERGRAYYPGTYNPAASAAPVCWSADGKAPDDSVKEKQNPVCNGCPMSIKGSKVAEGREMVACSQHRLLAAAPAFEIEGDPLRLKIAVTSDWDKDVVEHGWFAFRQYVDFIKSRGISHTGMVVTKMKFDNNVAYPKLLFSLDRLLSADEVDQVRRALGNPDLAKLLSESWTPAGVNGTPTNESDIRPKPENTAHIHAAGTDDEKWWDGDAWVKPWQTSAPAPADPPPPANDPAPPPASEQVIDQKPKEATPEPPPAPKPTNPAHIAHAGTQSEVWWNGTAWVAPWDKVVTAAEAGFRSPDAEPAPTPAPEPEPVKPAVAKPANPAHIAHEGTESEMWWVDGAWKKVSEIEAGNAATSATPAASGGSQSADTGQAPDTSASGTTATSTASPSEVPAEAQALLDKWTG